MQALAINVCVTIVLAAVFVSVTAFRRMPRLVPQAALIVSAVTAAILDSDGGPPVVE